MGSRLALHTTLLRLRMEWQQAEDRRLVRRAKPRPARRIRPRWPRRPQSCPGAAVRAKATWWPRACCRTQARSPPPRVRPPRSTHWTNHPVLRRPRQRPGRAPACGDWRGHPRCLAR
eukprot:scaffold16347_cov138-Isochrysis_galbana.AAC.4